MYLSLLFTQFRICDIFGGSLRYTFSLEQVLQLISHLKISYPAVAEIMQLYIDEHMVSTKRDNFFLVSF